MKKQYNPFGGKGGIILLKLHHINLRIFIKRNGGSGEFHANRKSEYMIGIKGFRLKKQQMLITVKYGTQQCKYQQYITDVF
jgi:hypothetical protein